MTLPIEDQKRIEEFEDRFVGKTGFSTDYSVAMTAWLRTLLTEKNQEREAAVEEAKREERERIWNVAGEYRYQYEENGELDQYSKGANRVVRSIWEALGGVQDERGIYHLK